MGPKKQSSSKGSASESKGGDAKKGGKPGAGTAVKLRHILCSKESKALEAIQRIKNGEKFNVVAQEMSEDKARSGGDLGWQVRNQLVGPVQEAAFNLPKSSLANPIISDVVKSTFGYHVLLVEDKKS